VVSFTSVQATYYKGTAAVTNEEKDGKTYRTFRF
jgi:hypothetical protein